MRGVIKFIKALKPWKVPTRSDGITIDNAALAKLIGRK